MSETLRLRSDDLTWRTVEGEIVVLDQRSSTYVAVNPTGAVLWPMLVEGASREELTAELVARFGVDQQRAGSDVDSFVGRLADRDLLQP